MAYTNTLSFWFYLTLSTSLLILFISLSIPASQNSDFLTYPNDLRHHYFSGKFVKLKNSQIFATEQNTDGDTEPEHVFLLHGLACSSYSFRHIIKLLGSRGVHAIAIDLPGSGFSDKFEPFEIKEVGFFGWVFSVLTEIREKGIFWGFDQLVETGEVPNGGKDSNFNKKDEVFFSEIMGDIVGEVFDVMLEGKPFHLVLHDSAWGAVLGWVAKNPSSVKSVTFIDSSPNEAPAFPFRVLDTPVLGELVLRSKTLYGWLIKLCCLRSERANDVAEVYRLLLNERNLKRGIVGFGKGLNYSFDLGEWMTLSRANDLNFQVIWSRMWSDRWIDEGKRISKVFPDLRFSWHYGGRWPQEDAAEEIATAIAQFVLSLPKSVSPTNKDHHEGMTTKDDIDNIHNSRQYIHENDHENILHLYGMQDLGQEYGN